MRRKSYLRRIKETNMTIPLSTASFVPPACSDRIDIGPGAAIPLRYANRHGLITGETGTGKSVTLMRMVEEFQRHGVPCFVADVKGDLSRLQGPCAVSRLDPYGETGEAVRAAPSALGPDLMARALDLSDSQAGALELAFHVADLHEVSLDSLPVLRNWIGTLIARRGEYAAEVGHVSAASLGVVLRTLLRLEGNMLASSSFDVARLLEPGVHLLNATRIIRAPRLYAALLMYILGELDRRLPEVGDLDKPRLAFFFDEAHLLFDDVPKALLSRIERTVRLIRSKGVGVYFASQRVRDVPENVRAQLAHLVAHSREFGIGQAAFLSIDRNGLPVPEIKVTVARPASLSFGIFDPKSCPPVTQTLEPILFVPSSTRDDAAPRKASSTNGIAEMLMGMLAFNLILAGLIGIAGYSAREWFICCIIVCVFALFTFKPS